MLAVPVLTAYLAKNPNVKGITRSMAANVMIPALQAAGKNPAIMSVEFVACTIDGLVGLIGHARPTLSASFLPVAVRAVQEIRLCSIDKADVVTPKTIKELVPLIEKGIR
jgi:hypothetical protein